MRAKEFIEESRGFSHKKSTTMSTTYEFSTMPSNNPYQAYRFGLAMANHEMKRAGGPVDQNAVIVAYTPEEEEIIKAGERITGHKKHLVADRGSNEPKDTNLVSPVAKPRKNRWGV
jgi:hypothetical protein